MKALFTIDDFMVAVVAALGYGFGEVVSRILGWPKLACYAVSIVVGIALEEIISKIAFSKTVQKKPINRVLAYITFVLVFLIAQYISVSKLGVSMVDYLVEEFAYVIGLPILGFLLNMLIRGLKVRKIRMLYGDGNEGYVFDVDQEDIEEVNRQNKPVLSEYDADRAVKTRTGIYVGVKEKGTLSFLGIPYAKPPVGELRWKAPEPLPSSEAVFEAENFGASAIQVEHKGIILKHHRQSEDCLTLNICTGKQKTDSPKPVLVLFHHGDFSYGGSADPLIYGFEFVSEHPDLVFVSFNYRLGLFGFIDFSEVPGGEAYPDALNLGLLDQIAALKWIRENISAFGGNPERITVLGFESGAASICLLAASEQAKGLFRKAFIFNGSPETAYDTPENSRDLAKDLLKETKTSTMEELLQLNTKTLKDAAQRLWKKVYAPTCDGALIPADAYHVFQDGAARGIPFIIGFPRNERQVFRSFIGEPRYEEHIFSTAADIQNTLQGPAAAAVQEYIKAQAASSTELDAKSKLVEQWNALFIYRTASKLFEGGNKVHLLYWDEKPLIDNLGSGTVDAAAALLGNSDAAEMYGSVVDADLSTVLETLLFKFISGNALELYTNEIKGIHALKWKSFPRALIVSDEQLCCGRIEDRLTEIKCLWNYIEK